MSNNTRRLALKKVIAASTLLAISESSFSSPSANHPAPLKKNVNHSVCRWTFPDLSLEQLCLEIKKIGFSAIDLVGPKDWPILQKHGVDSSMCNGAEINLVDGWNNPDNHSALIKNYTEIIPLVAKAGYKNIICFSGNRRGMDDEVGLMNCKKGLEKILPLAEKHKVIIHMELLNSRINHKDYMCDKSSWGIRLCKELESENFKLLYDIYHMQINEGDVIRTIKDNYQYFGHYHTAGNPGRNEIDEDQELNYPAIVKAILSTGFKGYIAQEFIPKKADKLASLAEAIRICDV